MENNNEKWQDHKDSLGSAISAIAYPFDTVQQKLDIVTAWYNNSDKDNKKEMFKSYFKAYYSNTETFNFYGLTIVEPF